MADHTWGPRKLCLESCHSDGRRNRYHTPCWNPISWKPRYTFVRWWDSTYILFSDWEMETRIRPNTASVLQLTQSLLFFACTWTLRNWNSTARFSIYISVNISNFQPQVTLESGPFLSTAVERVFVAVVVRGLADKVWLCLRNICHYCK